MKKQKRYEKNIIKDFLLFKGCKIVAWTELGESPDAKISIKDAGRQIKIAIEHTDYYVDAQHGTKSIGKEIFGFWREVQTSINRRVGQRACLRQITGNVVLDTSRLISEMMPIPKNKKRNYAKNLARSLAAELIILSLKHKDIAPNIMDDIRRFPKQEFPVSHRHIKKVTIMGTGSARVTWSCTNSIVSSIGASTKEISVTIANKAKDFPKFHWGNVDERWLLISASGMTVFNSAGPNPERVEWNSREIKEACRSANIEYIVFWDRMYNWYKEIYPVGSLVKREWRAKLN